MDLKIYAVKVGEIEKENISIISEINGATSDNLNSNVDNPVYGEEEKENNNKLPVYDVLLAGVEELNQFTRL